MAGHNDGFCSFFALTSRSTQSWLRYGFIAEKAAFPYGRDLRRSCSGPLQAQAQARKGGAQQCQDDQLAYREFSNCCTYLALEHLETRLETLVKGLEITMN